MDAVVAPHLKGATDPDLLPSAVRPDTATDPCQASRTCCRAADARPVAAGQSGAGDQPRLRPRRLPATPAARRWWPACVNRGTSSSAAVVRLNCVGSVVTCVLRVVTCVLGAVIRAGLRSTPRRNASGPGEGCGPPARSGPADAPRPERRRPRMCLRRRVEPEVSPRLAAHWSWPRSPHRRAAGRAAHPENRRHRLASPDDDHGLVSGRWASLKSPSRTISMPVASKPRFDLGPAMKAPWVP